MHTGEKGLYRQKDERTWTIFFLLEMSICPPHSTMHISFYLLNFEFPSIITKIVQFEIILDNYENEIIRISF